MNPILMPFHIPGTLAANINIRFTAPADATLLHVSAVGSNANDGLLEIGTSTDADAYLTSSAIGDSNVPAEFIRTNFVGYQYPRINKGDIVCIALDFDGAGGVATDNFTLVLTFAAG